MAPRLALWGSWTSTWFGEGLFPQSAGSRCASTTSICSGLPTVFGRHIVNGHRRRNRRRRTENASVPGDRAVRGLVARGFNGFASVLSGINHSTVDSESTSGLPQMSSRVPTQPSPCHCAASRNTTGGEISPLGTRVPIAEGESRFAEALGGQADRRWLPGWRNPRGCGDHASSEKALDSLAVDAPRTAAAVRQTLGIADSSIPSRDATDAVASGPRWLSRFPSSACSAARWR